MDTTDGAYKAQLFLYLNMPLDAERIFERKNKKRSKTLWQASVEERKGECFVLNMPENILKRFKSSALLSITLTY